MKTGLFTVAVDDYLPELVALTVPSMERYAKRIGASFTLINERKYPELSPTYEKLQVYELGKHNDFNILLDCDMAISHQMYNPIPCLLSGCIGAWMQYEAHLTLNEDDLIKPDGIMVSTNFLIVPRPYHEVWRPFDDPGAMAKKMKRPFCLDEFCISKNRLEMDIGLCPIMHPSMENVLFRHCNITTDNKEAAEEIGALKKFLQ